MPETDGSFVRPADLRAVQTTRRALAGPRPQGSNNAMVKALARALRWQRMLDDGVCCTIGDFGET